MKRNTTYHNLLHTIKAVLRENCTYEHNMEKKSGRSETSHVMVVKNSYKNKSKPKTKLVGRKME
jgi:hypothetical protein